MEPDRIVINAADARLELFLGGKSVVDSRVIVGRPGNPTPVLRAVGAGVTLNPPWTVPHSIAVKEILPKLKRNHAYLASQDMMLLDGPPGDPQGLAINWRAIPAGSFPYRVRQRPGAEKLRWARSSSSCPTNSMSICTIRRVRRPSTRHSAMSAMAVSGRADLAACVFCPVGEPGRDPDISGGIAAGQTSYFPLKKKLPVYFLYWTAFGARTGPWNFDPTFMAATRD